MTRKASPASAGKPLTLSDDDITSQRVTRRSLLGALGLGAGVAAAATLGATDIASADSGDAKKKAPPKKKTPAKKKKTEEENDSD